MLSTADLEPFTSSFYYVLLFLLTPCYSSFIMCVEINSVPGGVLIGFALNFISLGRLIDLLLILNLPSHEHCLSFHLCDRITSLNNVPYVVVSIKARTYFGRFADEH